MLCLPMTKRILVVVSAAVLSSACVKEVSSDERLERETARSDAMKSASAAELSRMKCDDVGTDLARARDEKTSEENRLGAYVDLYERLKDRTAKFEEAMSRNPDLAYQEGSQDLVSARETCIQAVADVRLELESLIREIMQMTVVEEIRGGSTVKVARLNFDTLRNAIEKLEPDDKDALIQKVNNAEKTVEAAPGGKRKRDK